ncbi:hypothetical protein [Streptomyces sp. NPDC005435]|uniref:hypothetical protein n=1 Tax=Streptomyces sp. NPDC005435 TaxID=3154464 RepID=UPI00345385DE
MAGYWIRGTAGAVVAVALGLASAGCSDGSSSPSDSASRAASAASSLASRAGDSLASATAEARRKLDQVKGGVNAKSDVKLGGITTDSDGRANVAVTADNTTDSRKSFVAQVNFDDKNGNLLDTVVVTIDNVGAGSHRQATARSHRKLSGDIKATVATALRH